MSRPHRFAIESIEITNTRARHEDTDYVSFSAAIVDSQGNVLHQENGKKYLGNVNNGRHTVGLASQFFHVEPGQHLMANYLVINSGHGSNNPSDVLGRLETASSTLISQGAKAAASGLGATIGTATLPIIGTALGALAGWIVSTVGGWIFADCDGAVAAEQIVLSGEDLDTKTLGPTGRPQQYRTRVYHPGTDSPDGCGSNSEYYVNWQLT